MNEQPTALRLADALEVDKWHISGVTAQSAADELRRLHELAESEGRWASDYLKRAVTAEERITGLEAALRQAVEAVEALDGHSWEQVHAATIAAKQALGEQA